MKKNISMVLMGMAALCACTKQVKFNPENAALYAGDSIQVSAENAGATPKLLSENTFVATVGETSGWIKAKHVGETNVYCDYDANSTAAENAAKCKVTVKPRHEYYTEPITDWSLTKDELIAKLGEPTMLQNHDGVVMLQYGKVNTNPTTGKLSFIDDYVTVYYIVDGAMEEIFVAHKNMSMAQVKEFLDERYALIPGWEEGDDLEYINAENEDDATVYIEVEPGGDGTMAEANAMLVMYYPSDEIVLNSAHPAAQKIGRAMSMIFGK